MNSPLLDPQSEWASLLATALADVGVHDVVASPGSRSTPFVLAFDREPRLKLYDVIDERSAAFFALGRARATGCPVVLLCTSGTAGAHWFPALVEAAEAGVPLIAITADRPLELQGSRAPQTVDQVKMFGDHVRGFFELGEVRDDLVSLRAIGRIASQAVQLSLAPQPGPVHLNVRGRKPLEPRPAIPHDQNAASRIRAARHRAPRAFAALPSASPEAVSALAEVLSQARRPLIVCGPASGIDKPAGEALWSLAQLAGLPVCAEPSSRMRFGWQGPAELSIDAFDLLLESERFRDAPFDMVLQIGDAPTSSAWERLLSRHPDLERWVLAPWGWRDPLSSARALVWGDVSQTLRAVAQELAPRERHLHPEWTAQLHRANTAAWQAERAVLSAETTLTEAAAARLVVQRVPATGRLVLGNSLPIRLVGRHCPASIAACDVLSQRGANGIDGLVSGAAGAAQRGRQTVGLLGDVTLLHDVGGLLAARQADGPLTIVVLDNGGGRIFEQLPVRHHVDEAAMRHFTTPHETEFGRLAEAFGLHYRETTTEAALDAALEQALVWSQPTLVRAIVPPHGDAQLWPRLKAEVDRKVRAAWDAPVVEEVAP